MKKEIFQVPNLSIPFQEQLAVTDLTAEDVANINKIKPMVAIHSELIADKFYDKILSIPSLKHIIEQHSSVERLKVTLIKHVEAMFTNEFNDDYLYERNQIALIHYLIKLEPKWYIAAFQYLYNIIHEIFMKEFDNKEEAAQLLSVVSKYISLEMQIVLEAYETKSLSNVEVDDLLAQYNLLNDISK